MYTLEKIKEQCEEICNQLGVELDVPVTFNKRLTLTLGRVINGHRDGAYNPVAVEFSPSFVATSTDDTIYSVIQHEMVHYYITKTTHEHHGHDALFKQVCARIGCKNDGCATKVESTVSKDLIYKYTVFCPNCGPLAYYRKFGKTLQNLSNCSCKKCKCKKLYYTQNF